MRKPRWTTFPAWRRKPSWRFNSSLRGNCSTEWKTGSSAQTIRFRTPTWNDAVESLGEYDIDLKSEAKPATRAEAAVVLQTAIQTALGTVIESPYTNEYLTRDRIRIGAWVNPRAEAVGKDFIETYSSGGFDWIIAHGALAASEHREMLLRDCDKYGVELILGDGAYKNPTVATAEYFDHPCFAGTYVTDEPGTDQYDKLAEICNTYYKETGGKLPYINLLPMYANAAQLKYGASAAAIKYYDSDPDLFKKYCDAFCEKFDPPYICTDIYPLNWVEGKRATYKDYCESINVIATSAREHDKDFWCCIQTFAWVPSKRTPTESEFRWQSYCMLSFGCKGLLCWTYAGYKPECPSLITVDGKRTNAWYDAATVFKEIRKVSDAFVRYKNIGALAHNCTDDTPYLKFSNPVRTFPTIQQIQCDDPLLVGCFAARRRPRNRVHDRQHERVGSDQDGACQAEDRRLDGRRLASRGTHSVDPRYRRILSSHASVRRGNLC